MDLYNEMFSDLHHKYKIDENGFNFRWRKELKKYMDDKDLLLELIEQITNVLNCKVDEIEHLKKENQDLEMSMIDMNDNWCESILYEIGLGGKNVRERLNSISLLEKKVQDYERHIHIGNEKMRNMSEEEWNEKS